MREVYIETTPNPNILKFVTDYSLVSGSLELDKNSDVSEIPLAQTLFQFPFVEKIFITANFIAISKQEMVDWELVSDALRDMIETELKINPEIYIKKDKIDFPMFAEMTPNPQVMKFISQDILLDGFVEVSSLEESAGIPLAKAIFEKYDFVTKVFISDNFIAVTKDDSVEWHSVMMEMKDHIENFIRFW